MTVSPAPTTAPVAGGRLRAGFAPGSPPRDAPPTTYVVEGVLDERRRARACRRAAEQFVSFSVNSSSSAPSAVEQRSRRGTSVERDGATPSRRLAGGDRRAGDRRRPQRPGVAEPERRQHVGPARPPGRGWLTRDRGSGCPRAAPSRTRRRRRSSGPRRRCPCRRSSNSGSCRVRRRLSSTRLAYGILRLRVLVEILHVGVRRRRCRGRTSTPSRPRRGCPRCRSGRTAAPSGTGRGRSRARARSRGTGAGRRCRRGRPRSSGRRASGRDRAGSSSHASPSGL